MVRGWQYNLREPFEVGLPLTRHYFAEKGLHSNTGNQSVQNEAERSVTDRYRTRINQGIIESSILGDSNTFTTTRGWMWTITNRELSSITTGRLQVDKLMWTVEHWMCNEEGNALYRLQACRDGPRCHNFVGRRRSDDCHPCLIRTELRTR